MSGMEHIQIVMQLVSTHGIPHIDHPAKVTLLATQLGVTLCTL